jgi:hypothetical protein
VACVIPTWDFFGGENTTAGMINTLPANCEIGSITAGTITQSYGINTNNGIVGSVAAFTAQQSHGILTNNGTVENAIGGSGSNSSGVVTNNGHVATVTAGPVGRGISTNNGTVGTANGSTASNANTIATNNGSIDTVNVMGGAGGSRSVVGGNNGFVHTANGGAVPNSNAIQNNNGTVFIANGGSISVSRGIGNNNGLCLRLTDDAGRGVANWNGSACFVEGPFIDGIIPNNIKTIYSLGPLSENATIAGDATVITLSEGAAAAFSGIGRTRRLGT